MLIEQMRDRRIVLGPYLNADMVNAGGCSLGGSVRVALMVLVSAVHAAVGAPPVADEGAGGGGGGGGDGIDEDIAED